MTNPFANAPGAATTAPAQTPQQFQAQPSNGFGAAPQQFGKTTDQFADAPSTQPAPVPAAGGDPFSDPTGPASGRMSDLVGVLILCRPTELETNVTTTQGVADRVIRADVALLDGPDAGTIHQGMRVFQKPLVRDLASILNDPSKALLIGRVGRGQTTRTPDKAPYIFIQATPEDKDLARKFLAAFPNF